MPVSLQDILRRCQSAVRKSKIDNINENEPLCSKRSFLCEEDFMIHQYKLNGYNIVLDIYSGSIHLVDDLVYDIMGLYESHDRDYIVEIISEKYRNSPEITREDIEDVFSDIEILRNDGKLFSENKFSKVAAGFERNSSEIKALCLHVSHTCNLTCRYCFASGGKYHGDDALMSFEVGKQALDFLIANSGKRRNLEVDFFGGEPLMNWDVVKRLVSYAREEEKRHNKNFRFTLTTNGLLIDDEVIEFSNREMSNVVLSLDGRKDIHDRMRRTLNDKGSYDIVIPKFKKLADSRANKEYYIRGTFTHNNVDFTEDILHMANLGFDKLSMEPVVSSPDSPHALTDDDLPKILEQYERLACEMLKRKRQGNGFTFYHYMIDLAHGPCIYKRISGCGAGGEYLAVTPSGELYPCHQFVGEKEYSMGDIWQGVINTSLRDTLASINVYSRESCQKCWAKLYCSGGCAANSYHATGSVHGTYDYGCELFKKRMECAIMLELAQSMSAM